jgi:heptaprenylglyceryl phosphate synthase
MASSIYNNLFRGNQKIFALLIDPENQNEEKLIRILEVASASKVDMILVGGSLTSRPVDDCKAVCFLSGASVSRKPAPALW